MGGQGVRSVRRCSGRPTKAALALQTDRAARAVSPSSTVGRHKGPILQGAFSSPGALLLLSLVCGIQPSVGASRATLPAMAWWPSPAGLLSTRRELVCCTPPMQTGSPVCPRQGWKGSPDTVHTMHPLPMTYKRPVQPKETPVLPWPEEKKKTKESILPKQCLHKSLSFSFSLKVVQCCLFSTLSQVNFLEKLLFV